MSNSTDQAIIAWTRRQILADDERVDMVPDGPWELDPEAHAVISASQGTVTLIPFPQTIKPVQPGVLTEAVFETFDPPESSLPTYKYLLAAAGPQHFRAGQSSRLGMLETCHRLLSAESTDDASGALARRFLRLLAFAYADRDGYDKAWAPEQVRFDVPAPAGL